MGVILLEFGDEGRKLGTAAEVFQLCNDSKRNVNHEPTHFEAPAQTASRTSHKQCGFYADTAACMKKHGKLLALKLTPISIDKTLSPSVPRLTSQSYKSLINFDLVSLINQSDREIVVS